MTYKGYSARIEYSNEDDSFIAHLAGISDVVGFHGESEAKLRAALGRIGKLTTRTALTGMPARLHPLAASASPNNGTPQASKAEGEIFKFICSFEGG